MAKLAYLWHLYTHPGKLLARNNKSFRQNWQHKICKYNLDYDDEEKTLEVCNAKPYLIPEDDIFSERQINIFRSALKERKRLDEKVFSCKKRTLLTNKIEAKFENIQMFQKAWLDSTLEKTRVNVKID